MQDRYPTPIIVSPRPKPKSAFFLVIVLLIAALALLVFTLALPGILRSFEPDITRKYDDAYATDGAFVYYMDNGYKKVDGADVATFRSLYDAKAEGRHKVYGSAGCVAGRDKDAVFIGRIRIEALHPAKTRVLFGKYITDDTRVYYLDGNPLPNADPATLDHIILHYARDRNTLYYKSAEVRGADPAALNYITEKPLKDGPGIAADRTGNFRSVDSSRKDGDYLKDTRNVYFRGAAVPGADPDTFRVLYVEGDQWRLTYAEDKNGYYFKGRPLPSTVAGTGEQPAPGSLKLLQADRNFGRHELFYANASVYAFNTQKEQLEHMFTRETSSPFTRITRGVYADDRNVFFSACRDTYRRGRRGYALISRSTYLQPLQGVSPEDFIKIGEIDGPSSREEGEIFAAGGVRYFHPRFVDRGAALTYMEPEPSRSDRSTEDDSIWTFLSRTKYGVVEPRGVKHIPLREEFAYVTWYRSFIMRNGIWLLPLAIPILVLTFLLAVRGYSRARRRIRAREKQGRHTVIVE